MYRGEASSTPEPVSEPLDHTFPSYTSVWTMPPDALSTVRSWCGDRPASTSIAPQRLHPPPRRRQARRERRLGRRLRSPRGEGGDIRGSRSASCGRSSSDWCRRSRPRPSHAITMIPPRPSGGSRSSKCGTRRRHRQAARWTLLARKRTMLKVNTRHRLMRRRRILPSQERKDAVARFFSVSTTMK